MSRDLTRRRSTVISVDHASMTLQLWLHSPCASPVPAPDEERKDLQRQNIDTNIANVVYSM